MDQYIIHVHTGIGWCDYAITRVEYPMPDAAPSYTRSSGFLQLCGSDFSASCLLTALAEELFNVAAAPPWDVP